MAEIDNHLLVFDRPSVYKCSCGFVAFLSRDGNMNIVEHPKGKIEYMSCGHAKCATTDLFKCSICAMRWKES